MSSSSSANAAAAEEDDPTPPLMERRLSMADREGTPGRSLGCRELKGLYVNFKKFHHKLYWDHGQGIWLLQKVFLYIATI